MLRRKRGKSQRNGAQSPGRALWLRDEVATAYDAVVADQPRAVTAERVRVRLAAEHAGGVKLSVVFPPEAEHHLVDVVSDGQRSIGRRSFDANSPEATGVFGSVRGR